jgi:nicotinamidase-related amidase
MAGIPTEITVLEAALTAVSMGYEVYVLPECSGSFSEFTRQLALDRMIEAGIYMTTWE